MRNRITTFALFTLVALLTAAAALPVMASDGGQKVGIFLVTGVRDCCEGEICIENGCWFTHDCDGNGDCLE